MAGFLRGLSVSWRFTLSLRPGKIPLKIASLIGQLLVEKLDNEHYIFGHGYLLHSSGLRGPDSVNVLFYIETHNYPQIKFYTHKVVGTASFQYGCVYFGEKKL